MNTLQLQNTNELVIGQSQTSNEEGNIPVIRYYNIRGLCQPIRNILYHFKMKFEDIKITKNDLSQSTKLEKNIDNLFNSGLPTFEDINCKICNSIAIGIYICHKYNRKQYLGKNNKLKAKVNQVMYKYSLQTNKIIPSLMDMIVRSSNLQQIQKEIYIKQMLKNLLHQSKFLNYCFKQHKKSKGWILGDISILDFYYYQTCFYVSGFFKNCIQQSGQLYGFINFAHHFQSFNPQIKIKQNNVNLFLPFKNQKIQQLVLKSWQGDKNQQIF